MSIAQLNAARELVKSNPEQYPSIVRGVLPVGDRPEPEIRLWCSGFIADFFCDATVDPSLKDEIACEVLDVLAVWILDDNRAVAKVGICILSEVYQRIYRLTWTKGREMKKQWDQVTVLKSQALARWTAKEQEGITVACIKLAQVIVMLHQQVSQQHPVLDHVLLTAEAAGLLDRLLAIFPNDTQDTFGVLSASLNATVSLALAQPQLAPRIVSYIMTFDLSKRNLGTPEQQPLVLRWVGKLFKLSLHPLHRHFPQISKYLSGLGNYCANESLKRRAEGETQSAPKRVKTSTNYELSPGPQPYKALYTLVDNMMAAFDARDLQFNLATIMAAAGLQKVKPELLDNYIDIVRKRLAKTDVPTAAYRVAATSPDSTAAANAGTSASGSTTDGTVADTTKAPAPTQQQKQPATQSQTDPQKPEEAQQEMPRGPSRAALQVEVPPEFKQFNLIINRLLGEAPIRVIARLSARGLGFDTPIKTFAQKKLYAQLVPDFRTSLEPLVLWLSEEYYASSRKVYFELVARVVDEIIPKLELADSRTFVRLLSELPELNRQIIFKIRGSCLDPERTIVGARALKFLIMFKPPCRQDCLDLVEELVESGVQSVKGILERYRPDSKAIPGNAEKTA